MPGTRIPYDALVLVGDGHKAVFYRNKGDAVNPNLIVEQVLENDNPPTREQGTDRPGAAGGGPNGQRGAMGDTDWHRLEETRFATDIADALYKAAHAGRFSKLVVAAPPKTLGELRKAFHKEVSQRIVAEVNKDLTGHDVGDIETVLRDYD
jgi:protein required for attachment to host cells